jgi:hypothetical protein
VLINPIQMKQLILRKTATNRKSAAYLYEVLDENGTVIATRSSNRDYVACHVFHNLENEKNMFTAELFYGRMNLIKKDVRAYGLAVLPS